MKFNDAFAHNGEVRAADHRLAHDAYLVKVKDPASGTEAADFTELVKTIPAAEAFAPPSAECRMS
jgi:hypothetical protein